MLFKVLKSSMDGISGGDSSYDSIEEVLRQISYHKGWDTLKQLHTAIRRWAKNTKPGSVFSNQATAIVAVGVERGAHADDECPECGHKGMDYEEFSPVESGDIEQEVSCPECGARYNDVFIIAERHNLSKRRKGATS